MRETLVLLPDLMCDARLFGPQIAALSVETGVLVAPLTRGERVEEIASGLLDLLPARFALLGQGLGGVIAMELLRRAPNRVARLALMGTHPLPETPQGAGEREPRIARARAGRLAEVMEEEAGPAQLAPSPYKAQIAEILADMANHLGPEAYVRQARALQRRRDQHQTLQNCKVPTLIMCGAHDGIAPVKRHEAMAEFISGAKLHVFEQSGHFPTLEEPDAVSDVLMEWLRTR